MNILVNKVTNESRLFVTCLLWIQLDKISVLSGRVGERNV